MTDTQIIDFLEKSIVERQKDARWSKNYLCMIGKVQITMSYLDSKTFREHAEEAFAKSITDRLTK